MTDPCTPPPGTKRKGWHVLEYADGERNERYWIGGCWWWYDKTAIKCPKNVADLWVVGCNPCAPKRMTGAGWRYIGPVEANTPTGIPADWADCPKCGARRFYPSGQCMQYCDKKPSPPDAKDALPYPNPWVPMSNPLDIKHIGKLAEEANELGAAIARCLIQGIDEREPTTGKINRQWLTEEIADVLASIELAVNHFDLPICDIEARKARKIRHLKQWHAMLSPT